MKCYNFVTYVVLCFCVALSSREDITFSVQCTKRQAMMWRKALLKAGCFMVTEIILAIKGAGIAGAPVWSRWVQKVPFVECKE